MHKGPLTVRPNFGRRRTSLVPVQYARRSRSRDDSMAARLIMTGEDPHAMLSASDAGRMLLQIPAGRILTLAGTNRDTVRDMIDAVPAAASNRVAFFLHLTTTRSSDD